MTGWIALFGFICMAGGFILGWNVRGKRRLVP